MRKSKAFTKAFTLVELLVVIGIIAVLISILLPALGRVRQQANSVRCLANLRQFGQAVALYTGVQRGVLPIGFWDGTAPGNGATGAPATDWTVLLAGTLNGKAGFTYVDAGASGTQTSALRRIFICPEVPTGEGTASITHYSSHPRLMPNLDDADGLAGAGNYLRPARISAIRRSSEIVLIFDGTVNTFTGGSGTVYNASSIGYRLDRFRNYFSTFLTDNYALDPQPFMTAGNPIDLSTDFGAVNVNTDTPENYGNVRFRHRGNRQANALMLDGHVETYRFTDLFSGALLRGNINVNAKR